MKKALKGNLRGDKGFTLIELMIVIAILGILAAVAIPKFAQMIERAREGATKGNIAAIRAAVTTYYGKKEGVWPTSIAANTFTGTAETNYIGEIPNAAATPLGNVSTVATDDSTVGPGASGDGWLFNTDNGGVWCNSTETDTKGNSFSTY